MIYFYLFSVFLATRLASFLFIDNFLAQGIIAALLMVGLIIVFFWRRDLAWCLLLVEFFLGGSGHWVEFGGLAIRTWVLLIFLGLWAGERVFKMIKQAKLSKNSHPEFVSVSWGMPKQIRHDNLKMMSFFLAILFFWLIFAALNGLWHGHSLRAVVQDIIPYLFLLLIFPAVDFLQSLKNIKFLRRLIVVFILGAALFALFNFVLFSSGQTQIHDSYYNWLRDVMAAKVTDLGTGFFRVTEPNHLLVVPLILIALGIFLRQRMATCFFLTTALLLILSVNFSRGYFLALAAGFFILKFKNSWQRWLTVGAATLGLLVVIFSALHLGASHGSSLGWELLGVRLGSVAEPRTDESAATRLLILPQLWEMIKAKPVFGAGLGARATFYNPFIKETVTTRQLDWGYLEMWIELGLLGMITFLGLYFWRVWELIRKIRAGTTDQPFLIGALAGLVALLIMNIFSPILFHPAGIAYLVFVMWLTYRHL